MLRFFDDRIGLMLFAGLLAVFAFCLLLPAHAMAQVVAAPPSAPALVQVQPFLHDLLTFTGIVLMAVIPLIVQPVAKAVSDHFHLKSAAQLSNSLQGLAYDAAHYGVAYADTKITAVKGINVGDPTVAAAANWLLKHASDEIANLNLTDAEVIGTVKAILPQLSRTLAPPAKPAS
jgi:hypothetical protein